MKWTARESVDVVLKARSNFQLGSRRIRAGEPILKFDTVKTSALEVTSQTTYVSGGQKNLKIVAFDGDKSLTFSFDEALLSAESLSLLAGADLIPARDNKLEEAPSDARSVFSHFVETFQSKVPNRQDDNSRNKLGVKGGIDNIWLKRKPYLSKESSIYLSLRGEDSGAPIQVSLTNPPDEDSSYVRVFEAGDDFVAFDKKGKPIPVTEYQHPQTVAGAARFNNAVSHYVWYPKMQGEPEDWPKKWPMFWDCVRGITNDGDPLSNLNSYDGVEYGEYWGDLTHSPYSYLLAPTGGYGQPAAFIEGGKFVYKVNVPSILQHDVVEIDYYVEYTRNATQVSILPEKFAPLVYIEGNTLIRRPCGEDMFMEFAIPKFKLQTAMNFTLTSTGDPSSFSFQGEALPDYTKFNPLKKVLADIQIIEEDEILEPDDPTSYQRFDYDNDEGSYLWKDASMGPHSNIDRSDKPGPVTHTPGAGELDTIIEVVNTLVVEDKTTGDKYQLEIADGDVSWVVVDPETEVTDAIIIDRATGKAYYIEIDDGEIFLVQTSFGSAKPILIVDTVTQVEYYFTILGGNPQFSG